MPPRGLGALVHSQLMLEAVTLLDDHRQLSPLGELLGLDLGDRSRPMDAVWLTSTVLAHHPTTPVVLDANTHASLSLRFPVATVGLPEH
jgi:hypothetical protein